MPEISPRETSKSGSFVGCFGLGIPVAATGYEALRLSALTMPGLTYKTLTGKFCSCAADFLTSVLF